MRRMFRPTRGFPPVGNAVVMRRRALPADAAATGAATAGGTDGVDAGATDADDAAAGEAEAVETARVAGGGGTAAAATLVPVLPFWGWIVPSSHEALVGVKVTESPCMPVTRRPLMVVEPEPRRELSGWTARAMGPAGLSMWTIKVFGAFSTV
jgi:hypothetical protein